MRQFLLDTSPLITLCTFRVRGELVIEHILSVASVNVVETVAAEATANPAYSDAAVVRKLLDTRRITLLPITPTSQDDLIDSYNKLGVGERDTIRSGLLKQDMPIILDDYLAFVIATRFAITPMLLLDMIVLLVDDGNLSKLLAQEVVEQIAARYSPAFVNHTRHKLK